MTVILWRHNHADDSIRQATLHGPSWTTNQGTPATTSRADTVLFSPVKPQGDVVAVALIPESLDRQVRHNRIPVASGMLPLRHADQIDVTDHTFWIAVSSEAERTEYSPSRHNADVYCFLTKARLKQGEPIAICPGIPTQSCGTIYKLSAWEAMLTQPDFHCASCGFDPTGPAWKPPAPRRTKRLEEMLELVFQGARQ
jgi:hypothetical protein